MLNEVVLIFITYKVVVIYSTINYLLCLYEMGVVNYGLHLNKKKKRGRGCVELGREREGDIQQWAFSCDML